MSQLEAQEFADRHLLTTCAEILWKDDDKEEFPFEIRIQELAQHSTPFEYLVAKLLERIPEHNRGDIRWICLDDELWIVRNGSLVDNAVLPF